MKKYLSKMNVTLLLLTILYSVFGSIMIYSASSILTFLKQDVPSNYYFIRQVVILIISFAAGIVALFFPTSKYRFVTPLLMFGIIGVLLTMGFYGKVANGTQGWIDLGFFNIQPAEFSKSFIILFMATSYHKLILNKEKNFIRYLIPSIICCICAGCVLIQPDLGSALIILGIIAGIFFSLPFEKKVKSKLYKFVGVCCIIVLLVAVVFRNQIFNSYQLKRFEFQNPCSRYTESTGYQVCNGFIAIKNGGLFGLGFGKSTQKYLYLPEAHTDFIFPIIVEELGLFVGILVILGYGVILYNLLLIAKRANCLRNSIIAYGTFFYLLLHLLVNLMGVLALIPLTGVPLPLLSYGGSFTLNAIVMLFICQRISIESKNSEIKEKISKL